MSDLSHLYTANIAQERQLIIRESGRPGKDATLNYQVCLGSSPYDAVFSSKELAECQEWLTQHGWGCVQYPRYTGDHYHYERR